MNTDNRNESATPLSKMLSEWAVNAPLPPRFQDGVWQRIERAESRTSVTPWEVLRGWLETKFTQPAIAVSYVAVLLFVGLSVGHWQARVDTSKVESGWQARYVQSVDPYQAGHR